jgi:hypothetical protein
VPQPSEPKNLVFQLYSGSDGLLIPLSEWERTRKIQDAMGSAKTWADFQNALPEGEWEALGLIVDPEDAFDPTQLPGYMDGEYPNWFGPAESLDLPEEFVKEFGNTATSFVSGIWIDYPLERLPEMKVNLRRYGFEIVRVEDYD